MLEVALSEEHAQTLEWWAGISNQSPSEILEACSAKVLEVLGPIKEAKERKDASVGAAVR